MVWNTYKPLPELQDHSITVMVILPPTIWQSAIKPENYRKNLKYILQMTIFWRMRLLSSYQNAMKNLCAFLLTECNENIDAVCRLRYNGVRIIITVIERCWRPGNGLNHMHTSARASEALDHCNDGCPSDMSRAANSSGKSQHRRQSSLKQNAKLLEPNVNNPCVLSWQPHTHHNVHLVQPRSMIQSWATFRCCAIPHTFSDSVGCINVSTGIKNLIWWIKSWQPAMADRVAQGNVVMCLPHPNPFSPAWLPFLVKVR